VKKNQEKNNKTQDSSEKEDPTSEILEYLDSIVDAKDKDDQSKKQPNNVLINNGATECKKTTELNPHSPQ
jgi:hypothetical protein